MRLSDLGEFGLIERLTAAVGTAARSESLLVGIGDDAAAWRSGDQVLLATTDAMVEGVHFLTGCQPWADVGWKALAANVSDIAAMGGTPEFALVTLAVSDRIAVKDIDALYEGLAECARNYGVAIVGGDIVRAEVVSVTVALLGRAQIQANGEPFLLRRDAAIAGQAIAVTGSLGDAPGGLRLLRQDMRRPHDDPLLAAYMRPHPPLALGQAAAGLGVRCGIDISDGLLQDLGHICRASKLSASVRAEAIPISLELKNAFPEEALEMACAGGEDYQLLLVGDAAVLRSLALDIDGPLTIIGETVADGDSDVRLLDATGREMALSRRGWDHLREA